MRLVRLEVFRAEFHSHGRDMSRHERVHNNSAMFSLVFVNHLQKRDSRMGIEGKDRRHWYGAGCLMR
jgi:hypothetical protein